MENRELIEAVVRNLSDEYETTLASARYKLSKDELIGKLIVAEATVQLMNDRIKKLERENHVWNSPQGLQCK